MLETDKLDDNGTGLTARQRHRSQTSTEIETETTTANSNVETMIYGIRSGKVGEM
ncbi:uncharacterized protein G2W53_007173 [Senna tora]|uniref:Uncharacterized protein n=1 Tax=Senna tora TaxID=362788 RepID=A0A835CDB5_9FABA|nr:uncharacterized protein G2W53_007173 [Senna tora]